MGSLCNSEDELHCSIQIRSTNKNIHKFILANDYMKVAFSALHLGITYMHWICSHVLLNIHIRPKKNIVCFRFPTNPIKTSETQIPFINFLPNFFFFLGKP